MYLETTHKVNKYYLIFWIVEDENIAAHSRTVETIWDALAATGGFFRVINLIFLGGLLHYQRFSFFNQLSDSIFFTREIE